MCAVLAVVWSVCVCVCVCVSWRGSGDQKLFFFPPPPLLAEYVKMAFKSMSTLFLPSKSYFFCWWKENTTWVKVKLGYYKYWYFSAVRLINLSSVKCSRCLTPRHRLQAKCWGWTGEHRTEDERRSKKDKNNPPSSAMKGNTLPVVDPDPQCLFKVLRH